MNNIFKGIDYRTAKPVSVSTGRDFIAAISAYTPAKEEALPWIAPGLFDLQINGFNGVDFNTMPLTQEGLHKAVHDLWKQGITTFLPTLVTGSRENIQQAITSINSFCRTFPDEGLSIGGIHLEGPFISTVDGPRGAHNPAYICPPDWSLIEEWQNRAEGKIKVITVSPEWPGIVSFIEKCVENNISVSIGHTAATSAQISKAVRAGARLSTHLGNGAHLMLPRHPNYIWDQLAEDSLWTTIIADGFHLPDAVLKVIMKVKEDHAMLISDCTKYTGMNPGPYTSPIGGQVVLDANGKLYMASNPGLLAGSARSLLDCVNYVVTSGLCPLAKAWNMASLFPWLFLNPDVPHGLNKGCVADFVLFHTSDEGIRIAKTVKRGKVVYEASDYIDRDLYS